MAELARQKLSIAILGGGFAGVYAAKTLHRQLGRDSSIRVGLISEENFMVFQPMLPEVAGASISPRHVVNPLRLLCRGSSVYKGRVEQIFWRDRKLILNGGPFSGNVEFAYDHLVLALGASIDVSRIPGMPEHANLIQTVGDAMVLRTTIIGRIEEANLEMRPEYRKRLLTFVVVGGGYSGVETAGQILDLFHSIRSFYPSISAQDLQVYLIHGRDHLLPTLSQKLGDYCALKLRQRGLKLLLNQRVKAVTANSVYLQDKTTIETNTVICTVGNAPHPLVVRLCAECNFASEGGQIVTDEHCRVKGETNLWAIGDCAAVPHVNGGFCPGTAQFGLRQGILVGKNLARTYRGRPLERFEFKGVGEMASIGSRVAVGYIFGIQFSGFLAWWMWRSIYLSKLPRFDRKLRVVLDWTLDLFFPRDLNLLSPHTSKLLKEIHLEPGDFLLRHGEPAFSLYLVKSGKVEICDDKGIVRVVTSGEYVGERALLEDRIWRFDGRAVEPTTIVSIPAEIFHQIVRGAGSLGKLFQKSATRYQSRQIIDSITQKLSSYTMKLCARDLMQSQLTTLSPEMTVREALAITKEQPHSCYPFVRDGRTTGIINRDDFYEFLKHPETTPDTSLKEVTVAELPMVKTDTTVPELVETLIRSGTNKLLVTDGDQRLQGIVTLIDLISKNQEGSAGLTREAGNPKS